jgi:hypothetical protein
MISIIVNCDNFSFFLLKLFFLVKFFIEFLLDFFVVPQKLHSWAKLTHFEFFLECLIVYVPEAFSRNLFLLELCPEVSDSSLLAELLYIIVWVLSLPELLLLLFFLLLLGFPLFVRVGFGEAIIFNLLNRSVSPIILWLDGEDGSQSSNNVIDLVELENDILELVPSEHILIIALEVVKDLIDFRLISQGRFKDLPCLLL